MALHIVGDELFIQGEGVDRRLPFAEVRVAEKLGSAPRRFTLPDGAFCEAQDHLGIAALLRQARYREGLVDRAQRHLPLVLLALAATVLVVLASWRWALPWAAGVGADHLPAGVGHLLGAQTLNLLDQHLLKPSTVNSARRERLATAFAALRTPEGRPPESRLLFRASAPIGPNAFTLPDGNIIMLDELLAILDKDEAAGNAQALAVLCHELGHARHRDALRQLLQSSAVAAFWSFYVGDISSLLAAAPAAVVQARYSQDMEQLADDYAARTLRLNGISPLRLAEALEKLKAAHPDAGNGGYLATHPAVDERIRHLREAADARDA